MNNKKQHLNDKLQKSSLLFLQLGLVLALFLTYTALEFESVKTNIFADDKSFEPSIEIEPDIPTILIKTKVPAKKPPRSKSIETIIIKPDDAPTFEDILPSPDPEEPSISKQIDQLPDDTRIVKDVPQPFILIENPPIFPGCEDLEKEASKQCFTDEISKFVNRKFNTGIAEGLSGKQKIWVQFVVDKSGTVTDIQARSPYKKLEKEAIRVVEKLPQMIPGKQRTKPVKVRYTLPIVFQTY